MDIENSLRRIASELLRLADHASLIELNPDRFIKIKDAAKMLGVSMNTMRQWDNSGRLKAVRSVGKKQGHRSYPLSIIQDAVAKMRQDAAAAEITDPSNIAEESFGTEEAESRATRSGTKFPA